MRTPDLTIIVPVFNVELWIEDCLKSILALEQKIEFELIIVDDGSTDKTPCIITRIIESHRKNIVVIKQKNQGMSAARNAGLAIAKGKYLSFIDSDDFISPVEYLRFIKHAKNLDVDILVGNSKAIWGKAFENERIIIKTLPSTSIQSGKSFFKSFLGMGNINTVVWDKIYKTEFLNSNNVRYMEGLIHEDVPFNFDAFNAAGRVSFVDIPFYYYRQRSGSIMHTLNTRSASSRLKLTERMISVFEEQNIDIKEFNDYLVYQVCRAWEDGLLVGRGLALKLFWKKLSLKKRVLCISIIILGRSKFKSKLKS